MDVWSPSFSPMPSKSTSPESWTRGAGEEIGGKSKVSVVQSRINCGVPHTSIAHTSWVTVVSLRLVMASALALWLLLRTFSSSLYSLDPLSLPSSPCSCIQGSDCESQLRRETAIVRAQRRPDRAELEEGGGQKRLRRTWRGYW